MKVKTSNQSSGKPDGRSFGVKIKTGVKAGIKK
jgi:hypothetical protein